MTKKSVEKVEEKRPSTGDLQRGWLDYDPFNEMERYFERLMPRHWMEPFRWERPAAFADMAQALERRAPRVDVIEHDEEVVVHAEIPGVDKKDLEVTLTDDALTIKGTTRHESQEAESNYHRREISRGTFSRTVRLPTAVDAEKAKASFNDGMLELKLPKVSKAKRRSVPID